MTFEKSLTNSLSGRLRLLVSVDLVIRSRDFNLPVTWLSSVFIRSGFEFVFNFILVFDGSYYKFYRFCVVFR